MDDTSKKLSCSDILLEALKRSGACGADLLKSVNTDIPYDNISKKQEILILSLIPTSVLVLILISWFLNRYGGTQAEISQSIALLAIFLGGGNRFIRGIQDLLLRHNVTVDVFVSVALIATIAIGEYLSAAIVIFIMAVSGAIEGYTMDKSNRSIQHFLNLSPKTATLLMEGKETEIEIEEISIGDHLVVNPGKRIPADGIVINGFADVNESVITGEALPVSKQIGSEVFTGTLNESGRIVIEVNKETNDTVFAQIAQMVNASQNNKAPIQRTVDRFTTWYLPIILAATIIGYLITRNMQSAVSILLVAAPCALAIGTPTAVSAAMANMTKKGIFIKGGTYFEAAGKLDVLMLDKTGTLTTGIPTVFGSWTVEGLQADEMLYWAASAEQDSLHPFAKALKLEAEKRNITLTKPSRFSSITGSGVQAIINGNVVDVGKPDYINGLYSISSNIIDQIASCAKDKHSFVAVAVNGSLYGTFLFEDEIRQDARQSIEMIQQMIGNEHVIMLSGDRQKTAESFGKKVGITKIFGGLMPGEKEQFVEQYQEQGMQVGMLGDGINDAPALAKATVGIAMGRSGTEFAAETADVVLMHENIGLVAEFIDLSKAVVKRIKLNIFFSIIFNLTGIILGNMGLLTPVLAIFLQEAGTMAVLISSTLLLKRKTQIPTNS